MSLFGSAEQWNRGLFLWLRTLMHLVGAVHFWYAIYYDFMYVTPPPSNPAFKRAGTFAGKFKYLTFLDAVNFFSLNFIYIISN